MATYRRISLLAALSVLVALVAPSMRSAGAEDDARHEYVRLTDQRVQKALSEGAGKNDVLLAEGSLTALGWFVLNGNGESSQKRAEAYQAVIFNAYNGTPRIHLLRETQAWGETLNLNRFDSRKPRSRSSEFARSVQQDVERVFAEGAGPDDMRRSEASLCALGWLTLHGNDAESSALARRMAEMAFGLWPESDGYYMQQSMAAYGVMMNLGSVRLDEGEPAPPAESARFVDQGDGGVLDTTTGLVWMKNPSRFSPVGWATAMGTMKEIPGGWRIPTNEEWKTLIPSARNAPGSELFSVDWNTRFWSSTEPANEYGAYHLGLWGDGGIDFDSRGTPRGIWPVRGATAETPQTPAESEARFVDLGDNEVMDTETNLIWLKIPSTLSPMPWSRAMAAVKELPGNWRLPTNEEWKTLIPSARTASGHELFSVDWNTRFWSSTEPANEYGAYHLGLWGDGGVDFDSRGAARGVWPVRDGTPGSTSPEEGPPGITFATGATLGVSQVIPIERSLMSRNGVWGVAGHEGWFVLSQQINSEGGAVHWAFGAMPEAAKGKALYMKLGDPWDGENGFYIFYGDELGRKVIVWQSPESYPRGSELRILDSGRIEFIGTDGQVKGFYHAVDGGWQHGWRTGAE